MKTAIALAIALALTSIAVMAVQTVMALDVGPVRLPFHPEQNTQE